MAIPGDDNLDEAAKALEGAADRINKSAERINKAADEAAASGRKLRIPKPSEPVVTGEPARPVAIPPEAKPDIARLRSRIRDAEGAAGELDREYREARQVQRRLSDAQRRLLTRVSEAQGFREATMDTRGVAVGPRDQRTLAVLQREGLVQPGSTSSGVAATNRGLGVADPNLILGDQANHEKFLRGLREELGRLEQQAAKAAPAVRRLTEAEAQARVNTAVAQANARYTVRQRAGLSGAGFEVVDQDTGGRARGTGLFRSREAADFRRMEIVGKSPEILAANYSLSQILRGYEVLVKDEAVATQEVTQAKRQEARRRIQAVQQYDQPVGPSRQEFERQRLLGTARNFQRRNAPRGGLETGGLRAMVQPQEDPTTVARTGDSPGSIAADLRRQATVVDQLRAKYQQPMRSSIFREANAELERLRSQLTQYETAIGPQGRGGGGGLPPTQPPTSFFDPNARSAGGGGRDVLRAIDEAERGIGRLASVLETQLRPAIERNYTLAQTKGGGFQIQNAEAGGRLGGTGTFKTREAAEARLAEVIKNRTLVEESAIQRTREGRRIGELPAAGQTTQMPLSPMAAPVQRQVYAPIPSPVYPPRPGSLSPELSAASRGFQAAANQQDAFQAALARGTQGLRIQGATLQELRAAYGENADAIKHYQEAISGAQRVERELAGRIEQTRIETSRAVTEYGAVSNAMRRHGAATTEFLTALGRGETTIRELGWQALNTAGKFGAWTAASVGVYGAITGVAQVGQGAIQSMSGVNEATRFINNLDTGQAQSQFRELAREMNLPISDVVAAYSQMGRVFNTQDGAMQGARATLLAMRVGELEVADATRFLGAIVQGFRLDSSQLPGVIDQINQAQNRLNFSIRDGAAGIARAAGSWRAAGGSFSELLAIMTTAQRSTGATGEVVGTALRRSAEFTGREANQAALRGFGIDVSSGIDEIYRQAFEKVRSGQVQGQDVTRLATALSSPQLAAVIGPTLQNFELYQKALRQTNAEASRGSARRELAIQLDAISERVKRVGTELQLVGSNLAQAGALDAFGGMLAALTEALRLSNNLLDIFNQIPEPIRQAATYGALLYGTMRVARRFNVGEALIERGGSTAGLGRIIQGPPERSSFRQLRRDLNYQSDFYRQLQDERGRQIATSRVRLEMAQERVDDIPGRQPRREEFENDTKFRNAQIAHAQEVASAQAAVNAAQVEIETLEREDAIIRQRRAQQEARNLAILRAGRRNAAAGLSVAAQYQRGEVPIAGFIPTFDRPTTQRAVPLSSVVPTAVAGPLAALPGGSTQRLKAVADAEQRVLQEASRERLRASDALRTAGWGKMAEATVIASKNVAESVRQGQRTSRAVGALGRGLTRAGGAARSVALAVGGMFGPLEVALIGMIAIPEIINHFQETARRRAEQIRRLSASVGSPLEAARQLGEAHRVADERLRQEEETARAGQQRARESRDLPLGAEPQRSPTPIGRRTGGEEAGVNVILTAGRIRQQQAAARRAGDPVPEQFVEEINQSIARDLDRLANTKNKTGAAAEIYRKRLAEFTLARENVPTPPLPDPSLPKAEFDKQKEAFDKAKALQKQVADGIAVLESSLQEYLTPTARIDVLRAQTLPVIAASLENEATLVGIFGANKGRVVAAAQAYIAAFQAAGNKRDTATLANLGRAQQGFQSIMQAAGPAALSAALDQARSDDQARNQAVAQQQQRLGTLRMRRNLAPAGLGGLGGLGGGPLGPGGIGGVDQDVRAAAQALVDSAKGKLTDLQNADKAADDALKLLRRFVRTSRRDRALTRLGNIASEIDAQAAFDAAQTSDPAGRAAITLKAAQDKRAAAFQMFRNGRIKEKDLLQYKTAVAQALLDQADAAVSSMQEQLRLMELRSNLRVIRLPEAQRGGATAGALRDRLAYAQEHGGDEETILGLQYDIAQQEQQNAQDAKARAEEARQKQKEAMTALYDLRRSRTDDPVRLAQIDINEDRRNLRSATNPTERRQAQAKLNTDRRSREEAIANRQIEDAQLMNDIGRMSDAQLARVYERLIKDRKLGTEFRRKLKADLLRLKNQTDSEGILDLNVGNIRLPTAYEVKRFVRQGTQNPVNVQQSNSYSFTVRDDNDMERIGGTLERIHGTSVVAAMRSAGVR